VSRRLSKQLVERCALQGSHAQFGKHLLLPDALEQGTQGYVRPALVWSRLYDRRCFVLLGHETVSRHMNTPEGHSRATTKGARLTFELDGRLLSG